MTGTLYAEPNSRHIRSWSYLPTRDPRRERLVSGVGAASAARRRRRRFPLNASSARACVRGGHRLTGGWRTAPRRRRSARGETVRTGRSSSACSRPLCRCRDARVVSESYILPRRRAPRGDDGVHPRQRRRHAVAVTNVPSTLTRGKLTRRSPVSWTCASGVQARGRSSRARAAHRPVCPDEASAPVIRMCSQTSLQKSIVRWVGPRTCLQQHTGFHQRLGAVVRGDWEMPPWKSTECAGAGLNRGGRRRARTSSTTVRSSGRPVMDRENIAARAPWLHGTDETR